MSKTNFEELPQLLEDVAAAVPPAFAAFAYASASAASAPAPDSDNIAFVIEDEDEEPVQKEEELETECFCCCEPFNKSTRARVCCDGHNCNYQACKICVRNYLTSSTSDPHCMSCKKAWSQKFLVSNLNQTWVSKEYKEHRKNLLTEQQIAKLPESMTAAANYIKKEAIQDEARALKAKIQEAKAALYKLEIEHNKMLGQIYDLDHGNTSKEKEKEKPKFIMPCPVDDCRGFLSTSYKCEICKTYACSKCLVPTGPIRDAPDHECNEDDVKSAEFIKTSTKPCPGCGERIYKISGCNQMWCVSCHTTFDWKTNAIITNAVIHNPHYYDWQRKNGGGAAVRNPGDVVCGGLPAFWLIVRTLKAVCNNRKKCSKIMDFYTNIHRFASHISYYELDSLRNTVRNSSDYQNERVLYINKIIDRETFAKRIVQKDNRRKRAIDKLHLFEMISAVLIDLFVQIQQTKHNASSDLYEFLLEKKQEFINFAQYCNKQFREISAVQNCKMPQINPQTWIFTSEKFSAKQIGL